MLKDNWKIVAELIGIAAIVLSLIFVGLELRQTQEALVANALQSRTELAITEAESLYNSDYMPDIIGKVSSGDELNLSERLRLNSWLRAYHVGHELNVLQNAAGIIDASIIGEVERSLYRSMGVYGFREYALEYWDNFKEDYSPQYQELVESVLTRLSQESR